jgi:acetylornithine and succinylornithine aminotransferases
MQQELLNDAKRYLMENYSRIDIALTKGKGVVVYDSEGNSYLDFTSGIGVNSLGYCGDEWMATVGEQLRNITHTSNIYYNISSIKLAKKLVECSGMYNAMFVNSGAEANEAAIKIARKYSFDKYGKGRSTIITLKQSFHGRTVTTLSATGQDKFHNYFFPFTEGFKFAQANDIDDLKSILDSSVCAIMMEAIQGEGGVRPLDTDYVKCVENICRENDILLMFDEVQCGIGRTGYLFGYNNFGVQPDIVSCAKGLASGLPIGAVLCNEKTGHVLKPGDHGSTFGGNAVSCAAALTVLSRICSSEFLENVKKKGDIIKEFFTKNSSSNIKEIRGKGLMVGIEIKGKSADVQKAALEEGLLVLTAGPNVVRLLPPLVISEEELTEGLNLLYKAIEEAGA